MKQSELEFLPEEALYEALQDRTVDFLLDNDPEVLARLPESVLVFARVNDFLIGFDDGGLLGWLSNSVGAAWLPGLPEDLSRIGAEPHRALLERFLAEQGIDLSDLSPFAAQSVKEYVALTKRYDFEAYDEALSDLPDLHDLLTAYARAHLEDFAGL